MTNPIPFPLLSTDRRPLEVEANRLRARAVAGLVRDLVRWVSTASR
jgi:hypothetical protein